MSNKQREEDAITAAKRADPDDWEVKPYEALIPPYPVWAAMFACGVARANDKYKTAATGLFQEEYETCIDLDDSDLQSYFKASALLTVTAGQIKLSMPQRNNIRAFVQWTKDKIRTD